jgi:hypothetical protein
MHKTQKYEFPGIWNQVSGITAQWYGVCRYYRKGTMDTENNPSNVANLFSNYLGYLNSALPPDTKK